MGLPCPYVLLDALKDRERKRIEVLVPEDEVYRVKPKVKKEEAAVPLSGDPDIYLWEKEKVDSEFRGVSQEEWEAVLLEVARRSAEQQIGRQVPVPVPADIIKYIPGDSPFPVSLWIAVAAAGLAVAMVGGPAALEALPGFVGNVMGSARTQGRGGFHKNSAAELEILFEGGIMRREFGSGGGGSYFPGILG